MGRCGNDAGLAGYFASSRGGKIILRIGREGEYFDKAPRQTGPGTRNIEKYDQWQN